MIFATSGNEAMRLIKEGLRPDMILLDIVMPEKDGFAVCKELKSNAITSAIPVIFIAAMDDSFSEE
jgi:putative two-component system response regulator